MIFLTLAVICMALGGFYLCAMILKLGAKIRKIEDKKEETRKEFVGGEYENR